MFCECKVSVCRLINKAKEVVLCTHPRALASLSPNLRRTLVTTMNKDVVDLEALFDQKRSLRSKLRKDLKNMDPIQRSQEDEVVQNIVLEAPWFKASKNLCAYISCAALREVDTSRIVSEILSNPVKVMQASEPVDLFILPGLAFDRSGRRLGRSGGYYDLFLKKYKELAKEQNWKQPLFVALSYSLQIMEEGAIPVTPHDVPVDALVSPAGCTPISPAALKRCN